MCDSKANLAADLHRFSLCLPQQLSLNSGIKCCLLYASEDPTQSLRTINNFIIVMLLLVVHSFVSISAVNVGTNPGLAAIWEDEQQRRREANESSQISAPPTPGQKVVDG